MSKEEFELLLTATSEQLTAEARTTAFATASEFESRVREVVHDKVCSENINIDFSPHPQAFPDIAIGRFGIEVKFTTNDTWRSVANSILETNRIEEVDLVYIMFGKMGGTAEVKWEEYEKCVIHVRTSHVPRFEVEIGANSSLFEKMNISYAEFRTSEMHKKMEYIRRYARNRLGPGERLWWLEDRSNEDHTLPIQARLYTKLPNTEKKRLRAEAILLCPRIVAPRHTRDKYDDVVLYLLTYHGVLAHQTRDMFSAGSVANPTNDRNGGRYIERAINLLEDEIREAAMRMDSALFCEYWGEDVPPARRVERWLELADTHASDWVPSEVLFRG